MRRALIAGLLVGYPAASWAQGRAPSDPLSPAALRRAVEALAHDSTLGRATPSRALDKAAQHIAERFAAAGLRPGGDAGGYLQRYPLLETMMEPGQARIEVEGSTWRYGYDFSYAAGMGNATPSGTREGEAVMVSGLVDSANVATLGVRGKVVIYAAPRDSSGRALQTIFPSLFAIARQVPLAIIYGSRRSEASWRRIRNDTSEHHAAAEPAWAHRSARFFADEDSIGSNRVDFLAILQASDSLVDSLLARAGVDRDAMRGSVTGAPRLTPLRARLRLHFDRRLLRVAWPSNVVGILPGTDPSVRDEYIVYTAHYDGLGVNPYGPPTRDSILNGADDNASGTAALLQIARALATTGAALKRSVVFVATSGEERGLWGSDYFVSHFPSGNGRIIANINLDMIGRAQGDTVYIAGDVAAATRDVITRAAQRSGGLTILDERALDRRWPNERLGLRSDHYYFMRRGIPVAVLFTGLHGDYHSPTDQSETLNYAMMGRIARVALEVGRHLAEYGAPGVGGR